MASHKWSSGERKLLLYDVTKGAPYSLGSERKKLRWAVDNLAAQGVDVSASTIRRACHEVKQAAKAGPVVPEMLDPVHKGGRPLALCDADYDLIYFLWHEASTCTVETCTQWFNQLTMKNINQTVIRNAIRDLGLSTHHLQSQYPYGDSALSSFIGYHATMRAVDIWNCVFLDETRIWDDDFVPLTSIGEVGQQPVINRLSGRGRGRTYGENFICMTSLAWPWPIVVTGFEGSSDGRRFANFFYQPVDLPNNGMTPMDMFQPGMTLVYDNLNFHTVDNEYGAMIKDMLWTQKGVTTLHTPVRQPVCMPLDNNLFSDVLTNCHSVFVPPNPALHVEGTHQPFLYNARKQLRSAALVAFAGVTRSQQLMAYRHCRFDFVPPNLRASLRRNYQRVNRGPVYWLK
jgi:hypothetical protein